MRSVFRVFPAGSEVSLIGDNQHLQGNEGGPGRRGSAASAGQGRTRRRQGLDPQVDSGRRDDVRASARSAAPSVTRRAPRPHGPGHVRVRLRSAARASTLARKNRRSRCSSPGRPAAVISTKYRSPWRPCRARRGGRGPPPVGGVSSTAALGRHLGDRRLDGGRVGPSVVMLETSAYGKSDPPRSSGPLAGRVGPPTRQAPPRPPRASPRRGCRRASDDRYRRGAVAEEVAVYPSAPVTTGKRAPSRPRRPKTRSG